MTDPMTRCRELLDLGADLQIAAAARAEAGGDAAAVALNDQARAAQAEAALVARQSGDPFLIEQTSAP
jgi:hypothetical protein